MFMNSDATRPSIGIVDVSVGNSPGPGGRSGPVKLSGRFFFLCGIAFAVAPRADVSIRYYLRDKLMDVRIEPTSNLI